MGILTIQQSKPSIGFMLTGSGNLALYVMKLRKKTWCVRSREPDTLLTRCSADVFYDVANNLLPATDCKKDVLGNTVLQY